MQRHIVNMSNAGWLLLVLIAIPTITSIQFGSLRISSTPEYRMLTYGGLATAIVANYIGACLAGGKLRKSYRAWATIDIAALAVFVLVFTGCTRFEWLKEVLLWMRDRLG
jgi:hypothetical protein